MEKIETQIPDYLKTIRKVFPSEITASKLHDHGDDFLVIEVNDEWMFRFPRNEITSRTFMIEKVFLSRFTPISPLPVPDYLYEGDGFGGYRKIRGSLLTTDVFGNLSRRIKDRIAQQLGQFLSVVHKFPVDEAARIGVTESWGGFHQQAVRRFREDVAPWLSPPARRNGLAIIEDMLAETFKSHVIHGDFAFEDHVFYNESTQQLCGVIDFADVTIDDPAHDFQNIVEYGGETFFQAVMEHYGIKNDRTLLKRTKLRIQARPLFEAAYSLMFGFDERYKERILYINANYK